MQSADELITLLENTHVLPDFLRRDMRTTDEIGFVLGTSGTAYADGHGSVSEVSLNVGVGEDDEKIVPVHTHPMMNATASDPDIERSANVDRIAGIIVLAQEMFETEWDGHAVLFDDEGAVQDEARFRIECDGSTDGPAEERHLANPRVVR